jgi:glycosyltransferase involved in cell wall biosynthesis
MNIALIGPGQISIPAKGWGGTEALVWNHVIELRRRGIVVDIFNSRDLDAVSNDINVRDYDFIHLHYDAYAGHFNRTLSRPYCLTSHWGEVKELENWDRHGGWWYPIYNEMIKCRGMIALAPEISELYKNKDYTNYVNHLAVGTTVKNFKFVKSNTNNKAICLGKIEPRKMQYELSVAGNNIVNIDFYGPMQDSRFQNTNTCIYRGILDRENLYNQLTDYNCMILLSKGEAAAQVIPEALAAGLSVCVTETAAGNLDRTLPFIKVVPNNWLDYKDQVVNEIKNLVETNNKYRNDIRKYALDFFDIKVIIDRYLNIIEDFKKYTQ